MREVLTFSLSIFVFCIGCQGHVPPPGKEKPEPEVESAPVKTEPYREPLVPKVDPPETPDSTGIFSESLGKHTAEIVPFPPVEDLVAQVDAYIDKIGSSLADLVGTTKYIEDAADIARDANALALVALALGLAQDDSKYKKSASQIIEATKSLADAKNFDEGQKAYTALKESLTATGGNPLSWTEKVANLKQTMKALPNLNSAVKRVSDTERKLFVILGRPNAQQVYSQLAALAVISQGSIPNVDETTKPDATAEWKRLCEEFRDAAIKTNAAAHQYAKDNADGKEPDYSVFSTRFRAMTDSCDDCHKVFFPGAVGKE